MRLTAQAMEEHYAPSLSLSLFLRPHCIIVRLFLLFASVSITVLPASVYLKLKYPGSRELCSNCSVLQCLTVLGVAHRPTMNKLRCMIV